MMIQSLPSIFSTFHILWINMSGWGGYVLVSSPSSMDFLRSSRLKNKSLRFAYNIVSKSNKKLHGFFHDLRDSKNPQDLQLLVAQVLSAFHMCNIMQHNLGLFLS